MFFKILFSSLLFFSTAHAQEQVFCPGDVAFDTEFTVPTDDGNTRDLQLNGVGLKEVFFVDIFLAAFYLENPTSNPKAILASDEIKVGVVHALRNIGKNLVAGFFDNSFYNLCEDQCAELEPFHEQFVGYLRDLKRGERVYLYRYSDRLEIQINLVESLGPIWSPEYGYLVERMFYGNSPIDQDVKDGILGLAPVCEA